jgi:hypothetical protein
MSISIPDVAPISAEGYEPVSVFGAALINTLQPWVTLHMAWVLDAIGVAADPWWTSILDQGVDDGLTPTVGTYVNDLLITEGFQPGYGAALNPRVASGSQLQYLAQFVGVQLPSGVSDATARSLILEEGGFHRGTPAAVIAAVKRNLSGTQSVSLLERINGLGNPDAYSFQIVVLTAEVISAAALVAAVNAVKPGGLTWVLVQTTMWIISELEAGYTTISRVEAAFSTVSNLEADVT